jgi:hypothetical protein
MTNKKYEFKMINSSIARLIHFFLNNNSKCSFSFEKLLPNIKFVDTFTQSFNFMTQSLNLDKTHKQLIYPLSSYKLKNLVNLEESKKKILTADINFRLNSIYFSLF